jgi:predicted ferric reductase
MTTQTHRLQRAGRPAPPAVRHAAGEGGRTALLWLAISSVVIVTALWLHGGGLQAMQISVASAFTSIGRLSGLVAANLLLIQVLLMARLPWVERSFGQDSLARYHRLVGFTSINLMLVHVVTIILGYAGADRSPLLSEAWHLVVTYPGMLLATAATAALIMVAVTSVRIARRRLRYESWHLLHLYAYLGVGLALPHELWTGADFIQSPLARAYWWGFYILSASAILVFRIGLPLWRSAWHDLRVLAVVPETPGVTSIYLHGRRLDQLNVRAGQFFNWRFMTSAGWTRAHPYSLSAAPRRDQLRITVKDLGDGSRDVAGLHAGTRVLIEGPYGRLTGQNRRWHQVTMIACGIGITPLRALLESEDYYPGDATLIYRASGPADFTFADEIEAMARHRGIRTFYLAGPRGADGSWLPATFPNQPATLLGMVPDVVRNDVFICGPETWMDSVTRTLARVGVPSAHVHLERFSW